MSRRGRSRRLLIAFAACALAAAGCTAADEETAEPVTREVSDGTTTFVEVDNPGDGATLSYSADSGMELLYETEDGNTYAFKDMNGNGEIDTWEDWRLEADERAGDLATQLSTEQIAGLMLFSSHETAPEEGLTDDQRTYLSEDQLRNVLNAGANDVEANVTWSNEMQAYVESLASEDSPYVPVNFSSDPRSTATDDSLYNAAGDDISRWPASLGLAATFDAETVEQFAEMTSAEYRAMGITTALSPQIDIASDPRWLRVLDTFGENTELSSEMAAAYVAGFQNTYSEDGEDLGWGEDSVNTMIKHFPGDGSGEGGRESHTNSGKYAVYPGDNFDEHLEPFLAASDSASVMTSYSIAVDGNGDPLFSEAVGTAYNQEVVDILRVDNGYEGVIVTDWGVTTATTDEDSGGFGMAWGAEDLTVAERHYAILKAGVDMFGGNNDVDPVLEAYDLWQADYEAGINDIDADTRFQQSATRILTMLFQVGLYDSPYLDLEESKEIVASDDKVEAGFEAQKDSVVMLKNEDETISSTSAEEWAEMTVYIPSSTWEGYDGEVREGATLSVEAAEEYFGEVITDEPVYDAEGTIIDYEAPDLTGVDLVLSAMSSPDNGNNFSSAGLDAETGTYYPLSLQYRPYTADGENVRQVSISGDTLEDGTQENRSYYGETSRIANEADLDSFERAVEAVEASGEDIPIITIIKAKNPVVPTEFEEDSDAILVGFSASDQALIEVALGLHEPQGRLPMAFPASMDAVEAQLEDVSEDMEAYVDSAGNEYTFGYGLNWSGVITDE